MDLQNEFRLPDLPPLPPKGAAQEPKPGSVDEILEEVSSGKVPEELGLWLSNGIVVRNLEELKAALEKISQECFEAHFHDGKNDFAEWVKDVISDEKLADELAKAASRAELTEILRNELTSSVKSLKFEKPKLSIWLDTVEVADIKGLFEALNIMEDASFSKALQDNEIDIAEWLKEIGEEELAEKCASASREQLIDNLRERLGFAEVQKSRKPQRAKTVPKLLEVPKIEITPKVRKLNLPRVRTEVIKELKGLTEAAELPQLQPDKLYRNVPAKLPKLELTRAQPEVNEVEVIHSMLGNAGALVTLGKLEDARALLADISGMLSKAHLDKSRKTRIEYDVLELETDIKLKALG